MKKIFYSILLSLFILLPVNVLAKGGVSLSTNSLTIEEGSSKTFIITAYNTIGDVSIKSNNRDVATVSTSSWGTGMVGENETKRGTITVKGNKVGSTTITLELDAATFDGEDLAGDKMTINVNVVAKKQSNTNTNTNKPTNSNKPNNSNNNKPSNSNTNSNLSKNNNLKELSVTGYTLNKKDNNHYTLSVGNNITSIEIKAETEDPKANVTGVGKKELKMGDNSFDIIVTSESGIQNKINLKVTRKEESSLEDLENLLNDSNSPNIDITITKDTVIPAKMIDKIREKKKLVNFNYYDENKSLKYTWIVDGNKVSNPKDVLTTILYQSDKKKEIAKASNYAEGVYASFKHKGELPKGIKVKVFVEDKFEDESVVSVYQYENSKLFPFKENLNVKNSFVEFEIEKGSEYFVTMSSIGSLKEKEESNEIKESNLFLIISIVELLVIIVLVVVMGKKNDKKYISSYEKKEKDTFEENTIESIPQLDEVDDDLDEQEENLEK